MAYLLCRCYCTGSMSVACGLRYVPNFTRCEAAVLTQCLPLQDGSLTFGNMMKVLMTIMMTCVQR